MGIFINKHDNTNSHRSSGVGASKVIAASLILLISMQLCCGSAIPIWEFLTRNEKMSYFYSTFGQLVSVHCKATAATTGIPVNQCKHSLLSYGYEKLQTFSDSQLDQLDPYQRNANELIWASIMRDHPSSTLITTRKPLLPQPPESSIIVLTHQKAAADSTTSASKLQSKNPLFDSSSVNNKHKLAMDMDLIYDDVNVQLSNHKPYATDTFLSGPLIFRVRPDGTPVEEDKHKPLPHDDDLEIHKLSTIETGTFKKATNTNTDSSAVISLSDRPKHRKIAMISDLKQQHLASMTLQRDLQPPQRIHRQYQENSPAAGRLTPLTQTQLNSPFVTFYFAQAQA
ncbi:rhythmically expressed gene 5 protein [Eurosta solidaginis]|uniref:rhythmically expressed gene 5 protein n=1 Tax=Eurosta solidaginis TaxID=178769 RepID=UPI003530A768